MDALVFLFLVRPALPSVDQTSDELEALRKELWRKVFLSDRQLYLIFLVVDLSKVQRAEEGYFLKRRYNLLRE